jgi:aminoglycoside phosphotransferase (APT) family kinase protein
VTIGVLPLSSRLAQAARSWNAFGSGDIMSADLVTESDKSTVLRLRLASADMETVIAKRSSASTVALEQTVYREVLPKLGIHAARYVGLAPDEDVAFSWLFLEDVPGEPLEGYQHEVLAGRFLAAMHMASLALDGSPALPDRGAGHFLKRLRFARQRLLTRIATDPIQDGDERLALEYGIRVCDQVEASWADVVSLIETLPRVFVHGDFSPANLRVRTHEGHQTIVPLDWEKSGWGTAPVDLAWVDVEAYWGVARTPAMSLLDAQRMRYCADLFRVLSHDWARKKSRKVRQFARRLEAASAALSRRIEAGDDRRS